MSEENKCNGLDCAICAETKCPNEEKEQIINGIDVSESVLTATNNDIYYSQKAVDELLNDIKRLQEENEGLKSLNDFNVQKIEVLQEENEELYKALEEIRNYASVLYGEPLIDGSKIRLKSGMYRIKTKINEVLNDRN